MTADTVGCARQLIAAIDELVKHADSISGREATDREVQTLNDLDGAVEGLRIQIPGLRMLKAPKSLENVAINYTQIAAVYEDPRFRLEVHDDWRRRMAALRSAATRLISPASQKMKRRDDALEARDKWIYEQCCDGVAYDLIIFRLNKKSRKWSKIESKQGVRQAAIRYAKRNELPVPPSRQNL